MKFIVPFFIGMLMSLSAFASASGTKTIIADSSSKEGAEALNAMKLGCGLALENQLDNPLLSCTDGSTGKDLVEFAIVKADRGIIRPNQQPRVEFVTDAGNKTYKVFVTMTSTQDQENVKQVVYQEVTRNESGSKVTKQVICSE